MTPTIALQDPIFRMYALFIGGLLIVVGLLLSVLTWVFRKNVSGVWTTYRGWCIMIPLLLGSFFLGRQATIVFFALIAGFGFKEYAKSCGLYQDWVMTGLVYALITATGLVCLMKDPLTGMPGWFGMFRTLPVYAIVVILMVPILRNQPKGQLQQISLALVGYLYIGWMLQHLSLLTNSDHPYGYLFYLIVAVELNDVSAFTFGKLFGRHKLRSEISPNKTWEGSLGALSVSLTLPWILSASFPHFGPLQKILTGLIVGIGGQFGDLAISTIKRDIGIKDMGTLIPGHGGILDRVNSLIFTAPLFLHMVNYYYGLYGIR